MTDHPPFQAVSPEGFTQQALDAAAALAALEGPAQRAAGAIEDAFSRAGIAVGRAFAQAEGQAGASLSALEAPAKAAAGAVEGAFSKAGESLARSLGRAAADGKITMAELASAIIAAVNAAAGVKGGMGPALEGLFNTAISVFSGARAEGGPVTGGGAYLVGERGPEIFRPNGSGEIVSGAGGMNINIAFHGEAGRAALPRSEAQIAQALARAASLGARRL